MNKLEKEILVQLGFDQIVLDALVNEEKQIAVSKDERGYHVDNLIVPKFEGILWYLMSAVNGGNHELMIENVFGYSISIRMNYFEFWDNADFCEIQYHIFRLLEVQHV